MIRVVYQASTDDVLPHTLLLKLGRLSDEQQESITLIERCEDCGMYAVTFDGIDTDPWRKHEDYCTPGMKY